MALSFNNPYICRVCRNCANFYECRIDCEVECCPIAESVEDSTCFECIVSVALAKCYIPADSCSRVPFRDPAQGVPCPGAE